MLNKICEDILHIQDTIKGRKRAEFRRLISHYTRLRERNFKKGIIGVAIRAVSGKAVNNYDMKALRIDDETLIADDDLIMDKMLEWFLDWHKSEDKYSTGIHSPDTNWLDVYENREMWMEMTAECGAEEDLRGLIWDALQSTRGKLDEDTGNGSLRQHMAAVLCESPPLRTLRRSLEKASMGVPLV